MHAQLKGLYVLFVDLIKPDACFRNFILFLYLFPFEPYLETYLIHMLNKNWR